MGCGCNKRRSKKRTTSSRQTQIKSRPPKMPLIKVGSKIKQVKKLKNKR